MSRPLHTALGEVLLALLLLLLSGQHAAADGASGDGAIGDSDSVAALHAAGRLQLDAVLAPTADIVPGQKLTLTLTIATDRWFAGGTRISLPEVPGLVILQTDQFASNASERRGEQNWVLQRWTLDIYPQRAGEFTIPPIRAKVQVNAGPAGDVEGDLAGPPLAFKVTLPASLAGVAHWVAAPEFTVSQSFDRSLDQLEVGAAFERVIEFEASDVMAMMLPSFEAEASAGLAAYPSPPQLDNSSNRGQVRASRRQQISYVVEAEGQYRLPAADFFWWDTRRGQLQLLSLPATEFVVGAATIGPAGAGGAGLPFTPRQLLAASAGLALLLGLLWLGRRYLPRIPLDRARALIAALATSVRELRKPALPQRLNPDSSAAD